ncbi:MAG: RluA family pseudouridine synthase [Neisseriaceae bacterium]|nr:RluA family pseudouridine synthase [Neisseriaceae bacterium]
MSEFYSVQWLKIDENSESQRLDNFLYKTLKGVPKSHLQRLIRDGQVRVNKKRCKPDYRLCIDDNIRIPPIRTAQQEKPIPIPARSFPVVYEDEGLLVINKPSGVAVHGGSGISFGVIEQIRQSRPQERYLELVHRLDKDTSGLLMIAKKRSTLRRLHEQLRTRHPEKIYLALCAPRWNENIRHVRLPLFKYTGASGEKMVRVDEENGQVAHSVFRVQEHFQQASLMEVLLKTGRTHQIRVHCQVSGCPILGDERYGQYDINKEWQKKYHLKRMFLHAWQLTILHPVSNQPLHLQANLPDELEQLLQRLRSESCFIESKE